MSEHAVFDQIKALTESLPLTVASVDEALKVHLERQPDSDGPMYTAWVGRGGEYGEVELRLPNTEFGHTETLLNVTLTGSAGPDQGAVIECFGQSFESEIASPRFPESEPNYLHYDLPWGRLSLGISRDDTDRLTAFTVAERPPEPPAE